MNAGSPHQRIPTALEEIVKEPKALEPRAWASEDCPGCRAAGKALTADKFYDAIGGGPLPDGCSEDAASCEIFRYRLVHGIAARRDCRDEDGQQK